MIVDKETVAVVRPQNLQGLQPPNSRSLNLPKLAVLWP